MTTKMAPNGNSLQCHTAKKLTCLTRPQQMVQGEDGHGELLRRQGICRNAGLANGRKRPKMVARKKFCSTKEAEQRGNTPDTGSTP